CASVPELAGYLAMVEIYTSIPTFHRTLKVAAFHRPLFRHKRVKDFDVQDHLLGKEFTHNTPINLAKLTSLGPILQLGQYVAKNNHTQPQRTVSDGKACKSACSVYGCEFLRLLNSSCTLVTRRAARQISIRPLVSTVIEILVLL